VTRRILGEDVTQSDSYTERVKRMVGKVHLQPQWHHPLRGRQGSQPDGPSETTTLRTFRVDREACRSRTCEGHW
jgi:hypothetical protein